MLDCSPHRLDSIYSALITAGFQIVRSEASGDALQLARRCLPNLFLVNDDPAAGVDAEHWIEHQHADPVAQLAVTPLIILAAAPRAPLLRSQEIPQRVVVFALPPELSRLVAAAKRLVELWAGE
jgi:hypothetical protein